MLSSERVVETTTKFFHLSFCILSLSQTVLRFSFTLSDHLCLGVRLLKSGRYNVGFHPVMFPCIPLKSSCIFGTSYCFYVIFITCIWYNTGFSIHKFPNFSFVLISNFLFPLIFRSNIFPNFISLLYVNDLTRILSFVIFDLFESNFEQHMY